VTQPKVNTLVAPWLPNVLSLGPTTGPELSGTLAQPDCSSSALRDSENGRVHLTNAYRKLKIASRRELPTALTPA
jgi:hypothetical protein